MNKKVFERRMLRRFTVEMKRLENDKTQLHEYDMLLYRKTSFFALFLMRMYFAIMLREVFKQIIPLKDRRRVPTQTEPK